MFFPATWTHPHESRVPISGDKWIVSSFINNAEVTSNDSRQLVESIDHEHNGCEDHTHDDPPPLILDTAQDFLSDFVWEQNE